MQSSSVCLCQAKRWTIKFYCTGPSTPLAHGLHPDRFLSVTCSWHICILSGVLSDPSHLSPPHTPALLPNYLLWSQTPSFTFPPEPFSSSCHWIRSACAQITVRKQHARRSPAHKHMLYSRRVPSPPLS